MTVFLSQTSDDTVRDLLDRGGEILSTPAGALGALAVIAFMLYGVFTERGWAWLMAALLFAATLADGSTEYFNNTLFSPLQQLRSSSKLVNGMLLAGIAVGVFRVERDHRWKVVGGIAIAMLAFEIFFSARLFMAGRALRGSLVFVSYLLLFAAIPIGVGRRLKTDEDAERVVRFIGFVAIPYIVCNILQYGFSANATVTQGRFAGISGNPQLAGVTLSFMFVTLVWLLSRPRASKWILPVVIFGVGGAGLLIIWTGSRTSALACVIGLMVLFRKRWAAMVVVGTATAVVVFVASLFLVERSDLFERLQSTENTRAEVWAVGLQEFASSPIFGTLGVGADDDLKVVESTPIQTLQVLGLVGFAFIGTVYGLVFASMARLARLRKYQPERGHLIDYILAAWAMMLVISMFEAVFLGVITFTTVLIYLLAALTSYVIFVPGDGAGDEFEDHPDGEFEYPPEAVPDELSGR